MVLRGSMENDNAKRQAHQEDVAYANALLLILPLPSDPLAGLDVAPRMVDYRIVPVGVEPVGRLVVAQVLYRSE